MSSIIAVQVKVDNGGSATILCTEVVNDPLFDDQVTLKGLVGLSWPVAGKYMKVEQWSIKKSSVMNWMVGPLRDDFDISLDLLETGEQVVPWAPDSSPHQDLVNHPEEVTPLVTIEDQDLSEPEPEQEPEPEPEEATKPPKKAPARKKPSRAKKAK